MIRPTQHRASSWLTLASVAWITAGSGCVLEDNPAFVDTDGGAATSGATDTAPTSMGPASDPTIGSATDSTDSATDGPTGSTTGVDPTEGSGCQDETCVEVHVGPTELACDREVDGEFMETCDFFGEHAVKVAVSAVGYQGGGRVFVHDDHGSPTWYLGGMDFDGNTTLAPYGDTPRENIVIHYGTEPGTALMRMQGPANHVRDLTLVCRAGCDHVVEFRSDEEVEGTETGGHLIENLIIAATEPETLGTNGVQQPFRHTGPDSVIRNNHLWGYIEAPMDMRAAHRTRLHHNTFVFYQSLRDTPHLFDVSDTEDIEIANNVFVSLTTQVPTFLLATDATVGGVFSGNVVEGFDAFVTGIPPGDPQNVIDSNVVGEAPLESPHVPLLLADAESNADVANGTLEGTSLDGVDLATATEVLPGAFQNRSDLASPRRTTINLGPTADGCGGPCDVTPEVENPTQVAIWTTWPGGTLAIHPGTYGGGYVSWPIEIVGMGEQPDEVVLRRQPEGFLEQAGTFNTDEAGQPVVRVLFHQPDRTHITNLSLSVGPDQDGIVIEGSNEEGQAPPTPHLLERILIVDEGDTAADLAERPFYLGSNVVLRNTLIQGGFNYCVTFGYRRRNYQATPATTSTVHNLTCRLTVPHVDEPQAAFQVASVQNLLMANIAVELTDGGALLQAQRRSSNDEDPVALDVPGSFTVNALSAKGVGTQYDGFTDAEGVYTLTATDLLLDADPLFVSPVDSHLDPMSAALDGGVDPATLDNSLAGGVALDGVDRMGRVIDRGCYEEGT